MVLITDLEQVSALAEARRDDFEVLRYQLQDDDDIDDSALDAVVDAVAAPIIATIDCKLCANCCRNLDVQLGQDDLERLAAGLHIPLAQLDDAVAIQPHDDPDIVGTFKAKPCVFLKEKLCSVYDHRPTACRDYPQFTPDFRWTLNWMIDGAHLCPIIYNVLDAMIVVADEFQRPDDNTIKRP